MKATLARDTSQFGIHIGKIEKFKKKKTIDEKKKKNKERKFPPVKVEVVTSSTDGLSYGTNETE